MNVAHRVVKMEIVCAGRKPGKASETAVKGQTSLKMVTLQAPKGQEKRFFSC